ncbi:hypothetical protein INQ71_26155, partial [Escherichia coli]|uniref:hypothetical protein n=1 Tax=Escherichia coli TaxID=562 RepID=UPI001E321D8B
QLEALIEELLTYARLDRPQNELHLSEPDLPLWLSTHLADIQAEVNCGMLCHNGQLNEKRAPPSSLVSQLTVPPIASAIEWTM